MIDFLFMDDLSCIIKSRDITRLEKHAQTYVDTMYDFAEHNGFRFNTDKTRYMPITPESQVLLTIGNQPLKMAREYKYLGFRFGIRRHEKAGGFSTGPQQIHEKAEMTKRLGWLKLLAGGRQGGDLNLLRTFYMAVVRSKMTYCLLM